MYQLKSEQPGYWEIVHHPEAGSYLHFNCPCGCQYGNGIKLVQPLMDPHPNHVWGWDGNEKAPTLFPSLRRGTPCRWHGFLKVGVWIPCEDSPTKNAANVFSNPSGSDEPWAPR